MLLLHTLTVAASKGKKKKKKQKQTRKPGRLYTDRDILGDGEPEDTPIAVSAFLSSAWNESAHLGINDFANHHNVVQQFCAARVGGCTWRDYYGVLDEVRKPFRDLKDPSAMPVALDDVLPKHVKKCDRLHKPTREEFLAQVAKRRPAIITGVADDWKAVKTWTWAYLLNHLKNHKVKLSVNPSAFFDGPEDASLWNVTEHEYVIARPAFLDVKFEEFVGLLKSKYAETAYYYLQYFPMRALRNLTQDLGDFSFADWLHPRFHLIWFGDGRTGGHMHYDVLENLMVVVRGGKKFMLFDPSQNQELYAGEPMPQGHLVYGFDNKKPQGAHFVRDPAHITRVEGEVTNHYSPIDPLSKNLTRWPLSKKIKPTVCKVKAGQVLYNPGHWWHHVTSSPDDEGKSIGVNIFYEGLYHRYHPTDQYFVTNRFYSHLYDFKDPRPGRAPASRALLTDAKSPIELVPNAANNGDKEL